jgi:hypothetical protein
MSRDVIGFQEEMYRGNVVLENRKQTVIKIKGSCKNLF